MTYVTIILGVICIFLNDLLYHYGYINKYSIEQRKTGDELLPL